MFHTPPFSNASFDTKQSITESYRDSLNSTISNNSDAKKPNVMLQTASTSAPPSPELPIESSESNDDLIPIASIPDELMKLIDLFIDDLKQPKYSRPLMITQLSQIFQRFYERFDRSCQQHFNALASPGSVNVMLNARETRNSGLSSIFNRSRSSSFRNSSIRTRTRTNSEQNYQQLLTPEEISHQIKLQEANNIKTDQIMDLCECEIFKKILQVGTCVPNHPTRQAKSTSSNEWKMTSLFRNNPEFIEFDKMLNTKLNTMKELSSSRILDLPAFLALELKHKERLDMVGLLFDKMLHENVSPCDKVHCLIVLHDKLLALDQNNADEILPSMIYLLITNPRKELFLNLQFIKLFRFHRRLKEKELYVTTNFEAAISFIDSLTTKDIITYCQHTDELKLPHLESISEQVKLPLATEESFIPDFKRSNSLSDLISVGNVIDSGFRNLMGRIKTYTPPPPPPPPHVAQIQVPLPSIEVTEGPATDWRRYKDYKFEDLKVSDMQSIFDIYRDLANKNK
ncbi:guanine nucleotide exchange factor MUK1 [Kluyveromyces lactis]|uniref:KLLA0E23321p n=1 Tax=Kluyveromyces lactis (strain ATCC 8585 / CBS 2359 / DSM 70799 / NBRC 1267 / NRRL Y-1140 / WM37) TaxID=284590 RepID=Q6CM35_KLULA|nr:uncharacterized protein KLLA0_E23321g [Kluyveromyces lactis]CAH00091.1 KLLA0E23321p [Kluyveromyces lactis]|eukprot:XP_455004.1 uncharacterized protein KLLA0_E23321g [Kluyveromyces lactis]